MPSAFNERGERGNSFMRQRLGKAQPEAPANGQTPSAKELYELISQAAYFRAEKRGFAPGLEIEDWREAEAEVLSKFQRSNGSGSRSG